MKKKIVQIAAVTAVAMSLTACSNTAERLSNIGKAPELSPIENPHQMSGYRPVSLPMPETTPPKKQANSLWGSGKQAFFKDQRAHAVGDILTVMIDIDDEATIENETTRTRDNVENAGLTNFLGIAESQLSKVLPESVNPASLTNMNSDSSSRGTGIIEREEEVKLKVAAMISEVLPNGNFVIYGRQEVSVNFEVRELKIAGVIRPEDIATDNSIGYEKIAEARIAYGGRGQITDVQQPRYGQQAFDVLFPF